MSVLPYTPTPNRRDPTRARRVLLMHDAGVQTRALSLRADPLKCCIENGDRGGARTHYSSLLPRRDNPYATSTLCFMLIVVAVEAGASLLLSAKYLSKYLYMYLYLYMYMYVCSV